MTLIKLILAEIVPLVTETEKTKPLPHSPLITMIREILIKNI